MSYCPKCGSKVDEEMTFCPKCGASLKVERVTPATPGTATVTYRRDEKAEKEEKSEKHEKGEKHEKREHGFMGPLIGGVILMFIGFALYLRIARPDQEGVIWALFFVLIGLLVIVGGIYGAIMASRRHPRT
jgi:UDP-N-acetylmuramyl pentapeptide phosphotransferase/UDP-N-acetylglucosamine-1-phosphate transferase